MAAEDELKTLINLHTKKEEKSLFIRIREAKEIKDLVLKENPKGIIEIRVSSEHKDFPKWYVHGYLIHLKHLGLFGKKYKTEIVRLIIENSNKAKITKAAKDTLSSLKKDYGEITLLKKKLIWKTEKFKKQKDIFARKFKTLN